MKRKAVTDGGQPPKKINGRFDIGNVIDESTKS